MKKIVSSSLSEAVYLRIKTMIIEGDLVPGARINKKELADTLAVSLTPVSEALSRLSGEKLIEQFPRRGIFVRSFDDRSVADLFAVRAGLEGVALRICVAEASEQDLQKLGMFFSEFEVPVPTTRTREYLEADKAFHTAILQIARIPVLVDLEGYYGHMMKSYEHGLFRRPTETLPEHRAIISAIKKRDATLACDLMMAHHMTTRATLLHAHPA